MKYSKRACLLLSLLCLQQINGASVNNPISHIIVLMMENRSFDHLLGWLKDFNPKVNGLVDGITQPRDPNDLSKGTVPVTRDATDTPPDDPPHDFDSIAIQMNNKSMDGFVYDAILNSHNEHTPVDMFTETTAPIINTLAKEYAVFDSWFCSIPGPTDPNRAFAMSGTALGELENFNGTLYPQQTYMDYLRKNGRSFAGYYQDDLWALGYFEDLVKPINSRHVKDLDTHFYSDVKAGKLADFTWLQPRMTSFDGKPPSWQHPDASISEGEKLIKDVYEALVASPKWNETLFLITYDEHGGFFDHVTPPDEGVPPPDEHIAENGYGFNSLGVRIPTIAISPWIEKGTVVSDGYSGEQPTITSQFDSTSILATSNILLGLSNYPASHSNFSDARIVEYDPSSMFVEHVVEPLSDRMAWSNTFAQLTTTRSTPRTDCLTTLPDTYLDPTLQASTSATSRYEAQRLKPINEPMMEQITYYCVMNYPEEHAAQNCPGFKADIQLNQGTASDWLANERKAFVSKLRVKEAEYDALMK